MSNKMPNMPQRKLFAIFFLTPDVNPNDDIEIVRTWLHFDQAGIEVVSTSTNFGRRCMVQESNAKAFLDKYIGAAADGVSYPGDWSNENLQVSNDMRCKGHRHDQSVASILIKQAGLTVTNAQDTYFAYAEHKGKVKIADSVCLWSEGI